MIVYHTIATDNLQAVLEQGLKCTSRGEKGDDTSIAKTDKYLDDHRPAKFIDAHVSRDDNLYAYIVDGDSVIDITDGEKVNLAAFIKKEDQVVLQLTVRPEECYVSDIDLFDDTKAAIEDSANEATLSDLAGKYWQNVRSLKNFSIDDIQRPEVMIPHDIKPDNIKPLK